MYVDGKLCDQLFSNLLQRNDDDFLDYYMEHFRTDGRISDLVSSKYKLHMQIIL